MEFFKKKQLQSSMELVQMTDETVAAPVRRSIFELLLTIALSVGCWYTFFSMFPNPVNDIVSILLIVGLPVVLYFLCRVPMVGRFLAFYVFIITAILFVAAYRYVWNGFLVMANIVVEVLNDQMDIGLIPFAITGGVAEWGRDALIAMIPVMLLEATAIVYSVYYKEPLLAFVMTAIPTMIGLCLKVEPSIWLLILLLLGWTGLLVLSAVAKPVSRKRKGALFIQNEKKTSLPYIFLSITLVALLSYILVFSGDDYTPPNSVDEARAVAVQMEEHLRYDKLRGNETDALSHGNLKETHPLDYTDDTVLQLRTDMVQPMYLRGFVGGSFEDDKWTEARDGAYGGEYTGAMEWLAQQGFYPWMQQDRMYRMSQNYDYFEAQIENINTSSKYVYLPYEAALSDDTAPDKVNYKKDCGAFSKGIRGDRSYKIKIFQTRLEDYDEAALAKWVSEAKKSDDWNSYADAEAVYRRYVYDTYLDISPEDYAAVKAIGAEDCLGKTISYTLTHIRKLFEKEFVYDIEQTSAPGSKGELSYFINESHSGNDMHFATAATILFRSAGIPARYAEGYYLSPAEAAEYDKMSDVTVNILDSHAHCWVEIYIDEVGWFPVEVIPGYYNMEVTQTEEVQEKQKTEENNMTYYQDELPEYTEEGPSDRDEKASFWWIAALLLILLAAVLEYLGIRKGKKHRASFGTVFTDEKVYEMYSYVRRMMTIDKNPLTSDPYDKLQEISDIYDVATAMTFSEFLRLVSKVRFGGGSLTEEEHKKMAEYALCIGSHVYEKQSRVKRFMMRFIIFCV